MQISLFSYKINFRGHLKIVTPLRPPPPILQLCLVRFQPLQHLLKRAITEHTEQFSWTTSNRMFLTLLYLEIIPSTTQVQNQVDSNLSVTIQAPTL